MIEVEHLTVGYGTGREKNIALHDVSLTVPQGTVCAVIGPSGCGKSTLLKVIAGLIPDYQGSVKIKGRAVNPREMKIGFMPQNYGLLPWKTVAENIKLGCCIKGESSGTLDEQVHSLCRRLGIAGLESRYPRQLSGGQQQRAGLARAFLLNPDILLMDEPFSALDAITREEMQDVFLNLWQENHITTVLVTHYVDEALYLGQQIALMSAQPGEVQEIMQNKLAAERETRHAPEFFVMGQQLRQKIKEMRGRS